jgi:uncharacterized RDD family membrane protein YckC
MDYPVEASCACCGGRFNTTDMVPYNASWICAGCKPAFFQRLQQGELSYAHQNYAGFWIRVLAKFVDGLVLMLALSPFLAWFLYVGFKRASTEPQSMSTAIDAASIIFQVAYLLLTVGYNVWFLGRYGATPGKMACKLRVVRPGGQPVTYPQALGRVLSEFISGLICDIGYIMAAFDSEKRTLHDRIASTRVIRIG